MRIGIDYTPAMAEAAGIGRFTRGMVAGLAAVADDLDCCLLTAAPGNPPQPLPDRFRLQRLPLPPRAMTLIWHRLRLPIPVEALAGPLDVFHSPSFVLPPVWRAAPVVTIHDLSFLVVPACADPRLVRYLESAVPSAVRRARLILADSQRTAADVAERLGVPSERIRVVPGGVDRRFRRVRDAAGLAAVRQKYRLDLPFVLSVGTLEPRKNLIRLIDAIERVRASHRLPHRLVLAGRIGWLADDLLARIAASDAVVRLDFVADDDLPALITLADAAAMPSLYEGFGLPVLEAMACGCPVVCSNGSSLPEVAADAARLVDPTDVEAIADGLAAVLTDATLRKRLASAGPAQAARFTWEQTGKLLLAAYREASS
ncbi:MAG: glycosyltransferase family 4 protein [Chloroflexi bacterium]|nr:glycosyltransferase family 4 protein [Chloroflexota bacterium]